MGHKKILHFLNEGNDSKFVRRKWSIVNDQSKAAYEVGNKIIYNSEVLKSKLCDYADSYILLRDDIAIKGPSVTQVLSKICALFIKFVTKIDGTTIDDTEDLDLVMPIIIK